MVYYDAAYAPFGETYAETGAADRSFTGQTQDVIAGTTGIYDFMFRQHSAAQGRWLVPDPAGLAAVDLSNPQTWNRYAYVGGNPLGTTDPLGLDGMQRPSCGQSYTCWSGYGQSVQWAHQGGVNQGPAASWGALDSLSFTHVPTTSVTDTSALLVLPQYHPPQLTVSPNGDTFYLMQGGWSLGTGAATGGSSGLWSGTMQLGVSVNFTSFGGTGGLFAGLAVDTHGSVATYTGRGLGTGQGTGFSGGANLGFSNGHSVCALGGPFGNFSGTFGLEGIAGTADYFRGAGDGPGGVVNGGGITFGVGGGGAASAQITWTNVNPLGNHQCVNGQFQ